MVQVQVYCTDLSAGAGADADADACHSLCDLGALHPAGSFPGGRRHPAALVLSSALAETVTLVTTVTTVANFATVTTSLNSHNCLKRSKLPQLAEKGNFRLCPT